MKFFTKTRLLAIGLIVMVLINIGTLFTIWYIFPPRHFRGFRDHDRDRGRPQAYIERTLNFTDEQKQQFRKLRRSNIRETRRYVQNIRRHRGIYFNLLKQSNDTKNKARRDSLVQLLGQDHVKLEEAMYQHLADIKNICNDQQKQRFNQIIDELQKRIGPGPAPNPDQPQRPRPEPGKPF